MLIENQICVLKAQEFRIASATAKLYNPRMFIILFFHKDFQTLVRARVIFRQVQNSDACWPEFSVETINSKYEVLEGAKQNFEYRAISFIKKHHPWRKTADGKSDQNSAL